jgi:hypothetical protein
MVVQGSTVPVSLFLRWTRFVLTSRSFKESFEEWGMPWVRESVFFESY